MVIGLSGEKNPQGPHGLATAQCSQSTTVGLPGLFSANHVDLAASAIVAAAAWETYNGDMSTIDLSYNQGTTLLTICRNPGISPLEAARFTDVGDSTLYEDIEILKVRGLVFEAEHGAIHVPTTGRFWPTPLGIETAAAVSRKTATEFIRAYPVSKEWRRITIGRLDGIASVYRLAGTIAELDDCRPLTLRLFRKFAYDALIEIPGGRTIGIVRQGLMRGQKGFKRRLDDIKRSLNATRPSVILFMAPSRRDRYLIALDIANKRKALHSKIDVYVGTEAVGLLNDAKAAHWQSTTNLHSRVPLETLMGHARRSPIRFPREDRADRPANDDFPFDAPAFHLTQDDKMIMEILADRPMIRRDDLITYTGKTAASVTRHMTRLVRLHGMVEQVGTRGNIRYPLSQKGVGYMARRDRADVGISRSTWSSEPSKNQRGKVVKRGHLVNTVSRESKSTDGLYRIVSRLMAEFRERPDYRLEYILPPHRSNIYLETGVTIRADASAGLMYRDHTYIQFLLEYEERAKYKAGLDAKLQPYRKWFASRVLERKKQQFAVPVLFVFPDETIEQRFVNVAADSQCCLPILSSNSHTLNEFGFLGSAWRAVWEPRAYTSKQLIGSEERSGHPLDLRRMSLIELANYRWSASFRR